MKKWQIENSEKSEISEILEKLFRVFDFALQPKSKTWIQKSWEKISEISEISQVSEFSTWSKVTVDVLQKNSLFENRENPSLNLKSYL